MTEYKDLVDRKKLSSGAKIFFFADGKYKFFPSQSYIDMKNKEKIKPPKAEDIDKVIDDFFTAILKKRGL